MNSVSTKTGDKGESGLANGTRLPKDHLIFEVLGTQDELNSWLGVIISQLDTHFSDQKTFLLEIQNQLFIIGAKIARSPKVQLQPIALTQLEEASNLLQETMVENWSTKFLFPGGNTAAAFADVARTVSRRFERVVVRYSALEQELDPFILRYLNRLSDYLYVLRCYINHEEKYTERQFLNSVE